MPELPEIEVLCRDLRRESEGKKITEFISRQPQSLNMSVEEMKEKLVGQRVSDARRRAKYAVISLQQGDLWIHLGLGGQLLSERKMDPEKGTTVIGFDNGSSIHIEKAFMGHTDYLNNEESAARWNEFGLDIFDTALGIGTFSDMLSDAQKTPIKTLLTDQSKIAGIGNAYADETLHRTGIHPARTSDSIPSREAGILLDNLKRLMVQSIQDRGAKTWVNLNDTPGHFKLLVHGMEICGNCGTEIKKIDVSGDPAYFCPREQPESQLEQNKK